MAGEVDPERVAEKVRALLDRAAHASTPEEEARTSALIGARMMKEAGLRIGTVKELEELRDLRAMVARIRSAQVQAQVAQRKASRRAYSYSNGFPFASPGNYSYAPTSPFRAGPMASAPGREVARGRRKGRDDEPKPSYVILVSAYRGRCKKCRREYKEGDEIASRKGFGATHATEPCRSYWAELDARGVPR